ncbi:hypothetical protein J1N35_022520 [Gossypium stocksii]|uniref:Uncharacterized protein n=1 Tax=Gossypium stocksii TaxID=47602 RepID=A0A9D3VIR6_9ROSI|nr:hypothetical protein J1N35_022520 [Gossypium stocksii]
MVTRAKAARLHLLEDIPSDKRLGFEVEVLQMIELDKIKNTLVGVTGVNGLSAEQHKQLFTDEPTSCLDARATAIVM